MPANFRKSGKKFRSINGLVNYRYGGRNVPGMYEGRDLPKAQSLGELAEFPRMQGQFNPNVGTIPISAPTNPGIKTNWMQRLGRSFGNIFRSKDKDVNIDIMDDPNWRMPNAPAGYSYGKRGGSTGPNGML
tara:strand:+ start:100 stop:492 length:393 start_codon:yes stop_codon:yes gene_type:complete